MQEGNLPHFRKSTVVPLFRSTFFEVFLPEENFSKKTTTKLFLLQIEKSFGRCEGIFFGHLENWPQAWLHPPTLALEHRSEKAC